MVLASHHLHLRKRIYKQHQPYPHSRWFVRLIDWAVIGAGIVGPLVAIPQIIEIWVFHNAAGVSAVSWFGYAFLGMIWILYGALHDEPVIFWSQVASTGMTLAVAIGAAIY